MKLVVSISCARLGASEPRDAIEQLLGDWAAAYQEPHLARFQESKMEGLDDVGRLATACKVWSIATMTDDTCVRI